MAGFPGNPEGLDGPPPNPATDPRAAAESSPTRTLIGGTPPGQPGQSAPPAGPDMSGVLMLGEKVTEAMISLAQMMPAHTGLIDQARALLETALAQWVQGQASAAMQPGMGVPSSPPPGAVSQAGPQYPGGGMHMGRPF